MNGFLAVIAATAPGVFLAAGLTPTRWANAHRRTMQRLAGGCAAIAMAAAIATAGAVAVFGPFHAVLLTEGVHLPIRVGVYLDGLSAVMMLLIGFIGCVIIRFASRSMDGEPAQGRFLRWICFTLGAVLLLVVSRNLVMFTAAWMLTSFGLHQLLTHYSDRPAALRAARKKFLISRLGDILLIAALALTYLKFGTFEYDELFAAAAAMRGQVGHDSALATAIGVLLVLGAMTKSAQFPMHSWLPDTMETPTPVSALMHAGIINAGGFLVLRLSPIIGLAPLSLDALAIVGALTALVGATVMMTQTSVKRALAYSTMAQMGYMMLQCGVGAFSAALLHIVAHSLYKAHAFLNSGSVVEEALRLRTRATSEPSAWRSLLALLLAGTLAISLCVAGASVVSAWHDNEPGTIVLGAILTLALTQLLWNTFKTNNAPLVLAGLSAAAVVVCGTFAGYVLLDRFLAATVTHWMPPATKPDGALTWLIVLGFCGVFVLQSTLRLGRNAAFKTLYVHAANGFYCDILVHKLVARIWRTPDRANTLVTVEAH